MCGIAGLYLKDSFHGQYDVEDLVDGLLLGIENRGRDATGMLIVDKDGTPALEKDNIEAHHFVCLRQFLPKDMRFALLHTRLGTKGPDEKMENNHPVQYQTCYATHNGVIWNDDNLFKDELEGIERVAEVDSIVVPTLIKEKGGMENALKTCGEHVKGSWALAVADPTEKPDEVLLMRGSRSPLVVLNHPKLVMWASTRQAIEDAWKLAIGTPPKYNKYQTLEEGEFVRIKEGGLVETGRFIEKPEPSRSFRTPHDWESRSGVRSYPGSASDRPKCFECGDKIAYYTVEDCYTDTERGCTVSWDVPVCYTCREALDDPKREGLTYRHATDKLRVRHERTCGLCGERVAREANANGTWVCSDCKGEGAAQLKLCATFRGDDKNADKFFTLQPGDMIPMEMRYAFTGGCESCSSSLVAFISKDGFAICGLCHTAEQENEQTGAGIDCIQCDNCDTWYPLGQLRIMSAFGNICGDCADEEGWTKENTDIPEDDYEPVSTQAAKPNFLPYIREAEEAYPIGTSFLPAEQVVATKLKVHLPFVAWLLHKCCSDHLADPALTEVWEKVQAAHKAELARMAEGA